MTQIRPLFLVAGLLLCLPASALAQQTSQTHLGVRAGVSGGPTQFVFGGHIETRPLTRHVTFRPNIEIGVGDNRTVVALNFEFAYWIPLDNKPVRLYLGGGPAAVITNIHDDPFGASGGPASGVSGGFNLMAGLQHRSGLFAEAKLGLIHSPTVKLMLGYAWR